LADWYDRCSFKKLHKLQIIHSKAQAAMGLYDRDYGRSEQTPWDRIENPRSITITLVVITAVIFLFDAVLVDRETKNSILAPWFHVNGQTVARPWLWWQFLTYGFLHDVHGIYHILFNMIGLFIFGRIVEQRLGQMEFLRFYLGAIVVGGIVGATAMFAESIVTGNPIHPLSGIVGASGGVIAVVILFACYYPNQDILLMFVFPVKAWIVATFYVLSNVAGAFGQAMGIGPDSNTAFTVHLAGAGFALLYYFRHWSLRWLDFSVITDLPARASQRSRRMKLKIHDPDKKLQQDADDADQILAKIHKSGESSLTSAERKTLERYSRRQREKRNEGT